MKKQLILFSLACLWSLCVAAQPYPVPVSEEHEPMKGGQYQPTWESLSNHQTPEWFRDAKFGI